MKKVTIRFKSGEEEDFLESDNEYASMESAANPRVLFFKVADGSRRAYNLDSVESWFIEPVHEKEKPS